MITVVEQDIYTSSLCFWGTSRPTNVSPGNLPLGQTYALNPSSVMIYRNREPNASGGVTPTTKRINRISIEPLWEYNYMNQYAYLQLPSTYYYSFFYDVALQPFIATPMLNNLTQNFFGFSASDDVEWKLNQYGPAVNTSSVNDIHYDDKFVLHPWEDLKVRLLNASFSSTLPGAGAADAARKLVWMGAWVNSTVPVAKIRIEMEEFTPSSQYYHRVSLNDLALEPGSDPLELEGGTDQEIMLVDLREGSPTLLEKPFDRLFFNNYFQLQNLDFRGAYPWGGTASTSFMYSIILHTEGNPPATRFIRKYVLFKGAAPSDLEINGLLEDIGPLNMQRGQYLTVSISNFEFGSPVSSEVFSARQAPAFWLNGSIT
tara:strand:+ start:2662 stop:3780 length:1119 start_codon:yes stop_codon:yes gene_type:complete